MSIMMLLFLGDKPFEESFLCCLLLLERRYPGSFRVLALFPSAFCCSQRLYPSPSDLAMMLLASWSFIADYTLLILVYRALYHLNLPEFRTFDFRTFSFI